MKLRVVLGRRNMAASVAAALALFVSGDTVSQERSIDTLLRLSQAGDAQAQAELGEAYIRGQRINKNEAEAFRLFKSSAEKGNAHGQFRLGFMYQSGTYIKIDIPQHLYWRDMAAKQGHPLACYTYGQDHYIGFYLTNDYSQKSPVNKRKAAEYFECGAKGNDPSSLYRLGEMLLKGDGIKADPARGYDYLARAAKLGNPYAKKLLRELPPQEVVVTQTALQPSRSGAPNDDALIEAIVNELVFAGHRRLGPKTVRLKSTPFGEFASIDATIGPIVSSRCAIVAPMIYRCDFVTRMLMSQSPTSGFCTAVKDQNNPVCSMFKMQLEAQSVMPTDVLTHQFMQVNGSWRSLTFQKQLLERGGLGLQMLNQ